MDEVRNDVDFIDVLAAASGSGHENQGYEQNILVFKASLIRFPADWSQA